MRHGLRMKRKQPRKDEMKTVATGMSSNHDLLEKHITYLEDAYAMEHQIEEQLEH